MQILAERNPQREFLMGYPLRGSSGNDLNKPQGEKKDSFWTDVAEIR